MATPDPNKPNATMAPAPPQPPTAPQPSQPLGNTADLANTVQSAANSNPSGIKGFFARLGQGLHDAAPQLEEIGARLAQAGGNPGPMQMLEQKRALDIQNRRLSDQEQTEALQRQQLQQSIALNNPNSPEFAAKQAAEAKQRQTDVDIQQQSQRPPYTNLPDPDNPGSYALAAPNYNTQTHTWGSPQLLKQNVTVPNPTLPGGPAATPPSLIGPLAPPSPTVETQQNIPSLVGMTRGKDVVRLSDGTDAYPVFDKQQRIIRYEHIDGTPLNDLQTQEVRQHTSLVDNGMGQKVPVTTTDTTTRSKGNPRAALTPPANGNGNPTLSANGNGTPAFPSHHVAVGAPIPGIDGKPPKVVTDAFNQYQDSLSRYNVMNEALPKALAGDQQAMINLLYNHIGMTTGLQKGARITRDIINEAQQSAPWMATILARIGVGNGFTMTPQLLRGVTLPPDTMRNMIGLAQDRLQQDKRKYQATQDEWKRGFMPDIPGNPSGATGGNASPSSNASGIKSFSDFVASQPH